VLAYDYGTEMRGWEYVQEIRRLRLISHQKKRANGSLQNIIYKSSWLTKVYNILGKDPLAQYIK